MSTGIGTKTPRRRILSAGTGHVAIATAASRAKRRCSQRVWGGRLTTGAVTKSVKSGELGRRSGA